MMSRRGWVAVLLCLWLAACGPEPGAVPEAVSARVSLEALPVTLEGELLADIAEGEVEEEGEHEYSEINFGTLTVDGQEILVSVSGELLRAAQLPGAAGRVRATLGRVSEFSPPGHPTYEITALARL